MYLSKQQRKYAKKIIKRYYRLKRQPTDNEIDLEIENLSRKTKLGICCDIASRLRATLSIGQHPIHF